MDISLTCRATMSGFSTIYKISIIVFTLCFGVCGSACPVLECWFVQEKPGHGGGLSTPMSQEKSLMFISTEAYSEEIKAELHPPADISSSRVYYVTDPAGTFCSAALNPPKGSVNKPKCEINPFMPHASMVRWASALTDSAQSPVYLQADWFSVAAQGLDEQLTLSNIMRAPSASKDPKVILSVSSKTPVVRCRLGEPVLLDCGFWIDPSSPLHGSGFSIEWRYQFRGEGRLVLAYDGKNDRFAETSESGAEMDITGLYQTGNASLILEESQVRHSGTYICTITALPLLAFPALVLLLRKMLIFLFSKRTERNNDKLEDLKTQKRKILEEVMETETYKNAKLILERFDPESKKKAEAEATPVRPHMTPRPGQELRQRHIAMATPGPVLGPMSPGTTPLRTAPGGPPEKGLAGSASTPAGPSQAETPQQMMRRSMNPYSPGPGSGMRPPGPPLARPILPRERGAVDRVIEYLVGDGPQNRYALICQQCFSHNGMALKEEFEFVAFRCAYCYFMNPARKTRPQAPRLPEFSFERRLRSESPETQSSAATETPEDSDAPEDRIVSARSTRVSHSGTPWSKVHSFERIHTDDMERTTSADPQNPAADEAPVLQESETEESQPQDVPHEEAEALEEQKKEDESN